MLNHIVGRLSYLRFYHMKPPKPARHNQLTPHVLAGKLIEFFDKLSNLVDKADLLDVIT